MSYSDLAYQISKKQPNFMKKILRTVIGSLAIALILPISSCEKAGCTNPAASNYSSSATKDDGSCKICRGCPKNFKIMGTGSKVWTGVCIILLIYTMYT